MRRLTSLVVAAVIGLAAQAAYGRDLRVGYNQAWLEGGWGHDLTDRFDAAAWERILVRTREGGGSAVRVWLHEGMAKEGVIWQGHRPAGISPEFLANVRTLAGLAERHRVQIYWTLFDGNWPDSWAKGSIEFERQFNVFNDKYGHGALFRANVVAPILAVLAERPRVNFALDVMNEVQGSVRAHLWPDGWRGARRFMRAWTAYVHGRLPGLRVTVSSGHHSAGWDIVWGRFDGVGLDFYDMHAYSDSGEIPFARFVAWHARSRGLPIVLGEFGQKDKAVDPTLQARVTERFLADARSHGFAAAFAWRLEDQQKHDTRFSFYDGDTPRPALNVMRAAAGLPPLTPEPEGRGIIEPIRQGR